MKIKIDQNSKMRAALSLAEKGDYYDALCIFSQVDSYESYLNRLACFVMLDDSTTAVDIYREAKQKYGAQYAIWDDLVLFNLHGVQMTARFCEPSVTRARASQGKLHADRSLLVHVEREDDSDELLGDPPDLNYDADTPLFYEPRYAYNNIYDVSSTEYLDSLRINMERCYLEGNYKQGDKYAKKLLQADTCHMPTLEAQISMCLHFEEYRKGLKFALKIAGCPDASYAAIGGAVEVILRNSPRKYKKELAALLSAAAPMVKEATEFDLQQYVYVAAEIAENKELSGLFASELFLRRKLVPADALRQCAAAFFNCGQRQQAKEACLELLRLLPDDEYAFAMAEYADKCEDDSVMPVPEKDMAHFYIPDAVAEYAMERFSEEVLSAEGNLTTEAFAYLGVVVCYCKCLMLTRRKRKYLRTLTSVQQFIVALHVKSGLVDFAKKYMFSMINDVGIIHPLCFRLITENYDGKAFVGMGNNYNFVDFAAIPKDKYFPKFALSISLCYAIGNVQDVGAFYDVYLKIMEVLDCGEDEGTSSGHRLAYALLRLCDKRFHGSVAEEYFEDSDDDKSLYYAYKHALKRQKTPSDKQK